MRGAVDVGLIDRCRLAGWNQNPVGAQRCDGPFRQLGLRQSAYQGPTGIVGVLHDAFRHAGIVMCAIFLLGLVVLPFAPETKGKPLPE